MKNAIKITILIACFSSNSYAGVELVCKGRQAANSQNRTVIVDCSNRKAFIDTLRSAWSTLRQNSIGGSLEGLCWDAYNQAKDMHPSISFEDISDSFLTRCNMGLEYIK